MRDLKVYLNNTHPDLHFGSQSIYIDNLNGFNKAIKLYINPVKEIYDVLEKTSLKTTCLAALNFDYLNIFDKIIVYGDHKYVIFIPKDKNDISEIDFHVFNYRNEEVTTYEKSIRCVHNLYNLIVRGDFFELNKK